MSYYRQGKTQRPPRLNSSLLSRCGPQASSVPTRKGVGPGHATLASHQTMHQVQQLMASSFRICKAHIGLDRGAGEASMRYGTPRKAVQNRTWPAPCVTAHSMCHPVHLGGVGGAREWVQLEAGWRPGPPVTPPPQPGNALAPHREDAKVSGGREAGSDPPALQFLHSLSVPTGTSVLAAHCQCTSPLTSRLLQMAPPASSQHHSYQEASVWGSGRNFWVSVQGQSALL